MWNSLMKKFISINFLLASYCRLTPFPAVITIDSYKLSYYCLIIKIMYEISLTLFKIGLNSLQDICPKQTN